MTPVMLSDGTSLPPTQNERDCARGFHAWVPWLAVHYPPDVRGGAVSFYVTWCARVGCDHHEQWDVPS